MFIVLRNENTWCFWALARACIIYIILDANVSESTEQGKRE